MNNTLRTQILQAFIDLYAPNDSDLLLQRMPSESEDEDGSKFQEYFDMIQTVTSAGNDPSLSNKDLDELQAMTRLVALKYGYPKQILLRVKKDDDTNTQPETT